MEINITKATLLADISNEVSHVADMAYGDNGASLYDAVVLTSKDDSMVKNLIDDAVVALAASAPDIATATINATVDKVTYSVPDVPSITQGNIDEEVSRFVTLFACAAIFSQRRPAVAPEYASRSQLAMDNINKLIRERTAPSRT